MFASWTRRHTGCHQAFVVFLLLASAAGLSGCQLVSGAPPELDASAFTGFHKGLHDCRDRYAQMDRRVDEAGVRDAAFYRVPGFPYLRTDRLVASFADEVATVHEIGWWLRRMRELDQEAREFEYYNLGLSTEEHANHRQRLQVCGIALTSLELADPQQLNHLRKIVQQPDLYSGVARSVGFYPLVVPLLKTRITNTRRTVIENARIARAVDQNLTTWKVNPVADPSLAPESFDKTHPDEVGLPGLTESGWLALAEKFAPSLNIETRGDRDRLGSPAWKGGQAVVDLERPLVHYHIDFARFGDQKLVQVNYFLWFESDGKGAIDSLVWRVTLGRDAQPMVYESMHASGRDHRWYPVRALERRPANGFWEQEPFFPSDTHAPRQAALRLSAGTHQLRLVSKAEQATSTPARRYELARYENLYLLPTATGGTRSLFDEQGLIPGSGSNDPIWLWSTGIKNPGALRQYGHHATAYIGRKHFSDPRLLEKVFVPPQMRSTAALASPQSVPVHVTRVRADGTPHGARPDPG